MRCPALKGWCSVPKNLVLLLFVFASHSFASASIASNESNVVDADPVAIEENSIGEINPFDTNIEKALEEFDQLYWNETGISPFVDNLVASLTSTCSRQTCKVWLQVVKSTQTAYLYIDGQASDAWKVSTGAVGHGTPNFETHPNGRIYDTYSSNTFPGGDYKGLGNMPYAVFIQGGFAVHGTPAGNWPKLGRRASHGCIRVHPDNARTFNRLVRQHGIAQTWITVQD